MSTSDPGPASRPPGSFRIGSVAGVGVYVRASWVVVAVFIASQLSGPIEDVQPGLGPWKYVAGVVFAVLLYGSILLHEVSHAVMARRLGLRVRAISLQFLGGSTEFEDEPRTAEQEFKVAVVGPVTSLAVGLVSLALLLLEPQGLTRLAVEGLAGANLVLGVLNLVPGLPLDGGRVLRAAVWRARGNMHAGTLVAGWGGRVTAGLVLLWPVLSEQLTGLEPMFYDYLIAMAVSAFLWFGASASMVNARIRQRLPALQARGLARRLLAVADDLPVSEAVRRAQEAGAGGMVTTAGNGTPVGIVTESALLSVPEERRPWMPVSAVSRRLVDGLRVPADASGEELLRAMARTPASEYLLVEPDGSLYGLLSTADVDAAFEAGVRR